MTLSRWFRQRIAGYLAKRAEEWGGMVHDYANGKWKMLTKWETTKGQNEALELIGNMINSGRDEIFITCVKVGEHRGYFVVIDSSRRWWFRWFWDDIYTASEAFVDTAKEARRLATKMGYRNPEETA